MASELARLKASIANARKKTDEIETILVRKAVITITAAATGFAETKGLGVSYFGVPTKLGLATLLSLGEAITRDAKLRRFMGAMGDTQLAAYTYAATKARAFIAGDGGVDGITSVGDGGSL